MMMPPFDFVTSGFVFVVWLVTEAAKRKGQALEQGKK